MKEQYVGITAAGEATETFYRHAPAYIETLDKECLLRYFTHEVLPQDGDDFLYDHSPRDLLHSITFFIDSCVRQALLRKAPPHQTNTPASPVVAVPTLQLDDDSMDLIFNATPGRLPKVTFMIQDKLPSSAITILQLSRRLYSQVKARGASVKVVCRLHYNHLQFVTLDLGAILDVA
jgi:hypothetical protein